MTSIIDGVLVHWGLERQDVERVRWRRVAYAALACLMVGNALLAWQMIENLAR